MIDIIAEIGQAHDGSLGILHSYIDALSKTGVNAVKFQTHIAEAESSIYEPFRVNFSYEDKTRYDYWHRMSFTLEQWKEIKQHCDDVNLEFISSPFSLAAVDLLEAVGVKRYKIGSGETSNRLLLNRIAQTGKPVILSSGMSNYQELDDAVALFKDAGSSLSVLQCTTAYPTCPENWGLNVIKELEERYNLPVGFSDHSGDIFACMAAAALGAELFEFHVVFHKQLFGPDTAASILINEVSRLADGVKSISKALTHPVEKNNIAPFMSVKSIFEKSLAVNKALPAGHLISINDLEAKKPKGKGIDASMYKDVIGRHLKFSKDAWNFINWEDVE